MGRPPRLATRIFAAHIMVVATGVLSVMGAAMIAGPGLFHQHMMQASTSGMAMPDVRMHAEEAFTASFGFAVTVGATVSLAVAAAVAWFLSRRIARPVEALASAADHVAMGRLISVDTTPDVTGVRLPIAEPVADGFAAEIDHLTRSFTAMGARLEETDRARTRLLADLSHELRTPLATLAAYIDGLEDGVLTQNAASWEVMRAQVARMRRLASDVRDVASAEEHALALTLGDVSVADALAEAMGAARPRFDAKGVALRTAGMSSKNIRADAVRLSQVLANLTDNALRHTPPGGTVVIASKDEDDAVAISVCDNGDGIAADQLEAIFDRFRRADPSRAAVDGSGSGLGLTIARAIVRAHGGTLRATSEGVGHGATFMVRLPAPTSR